MSLIRRRGQQAAGGPTAHAPAPASTLPGPASAAKGGAAVMANIGKSISIKGDVSGDEDTVIEGRVEGRVELKNHHLTIGPNGEINGEVSAKQVTVVGKVHGNIQATERIEVSDTGRVNGDLASPRLLIQEGGQLNGKVSMKAQAPASASPVPSTAKAFDPAAQKTA